LAGVFSLLSLTAQAAGLAQLLDQPSVQSGSTNAPGGGSCSATADDGFTVFSGPFPAQPLQQAVDAASPNGTVKFFGLCDGAHYAASTGTTQTVVITKPLTIIGGFGPSSWITQDVSVPAIVDPMGMGRGFYIDTSLVTLQNMTVTNGVADLNFSSDGGGIQAEETTLYLTNVVVYSNTATGYGGGANAYIEMFVTGGQFIDNQAQGGGGGLATTRLTLTGTEFLNNGASLQGGGIYADELAEVSAARFIYNYSYDKGGALFAPILNINSGTVISNGVAALGGGAFGVYTVTVTNSSFVDNVGLSGGGALFAGNVISCAPGNVTNQVGQPQCIQSYSASRHFSHAPTACSGPCDPISGTLTLIDTNLQYNTALYAGGAVVSYWPTQISHSEFDNNCVFGGIAQAAAPGDIGDCFVPGLAPAKFADRYNLRELLPHQGGSSNGSGGALAALDRLDIDNTTFIENTAANDGGGVYAEGPTTLVDSFFAGNCAGAYGITAAASPELKQLLGPAACASIPFTNTSPTLQPSDSLGFGSGGGFFVSNTLAITRSGFGEEPNIAINGGAGYSVLTTTVDNSIFFLNVSYSAGGALASELGPLTLHNNTFAANFALPVYGPFSVGGAVAGFGSISTSGDNQNFDGVDLSLDFDSSTDLFFANCAYGGGGAIAQLTGGYIEPVTGSLSISNSLFFANTAFNGELVTAPQRDRFTPHIKSIDRKLQRWLQAKPFDPRVNSALDRMSPEALPFFCFLFQNAANLSAQSNASHQSGRSWLTPAIGATSAGGAVFATGSSQADIQHSTFVVNLTDGEGGALNFSRVPSVNLTANQFLGNGAYENGGGLYLGGAQAQLANNIFGGNFTGLISDTLPAADISLGAVLLVSSTLSGQHNTFGTTATSIISEIIGTAAVVSASLSAGYESIGDSIVLTNSIFAGYPIAIVANLSSTVQLDGVLWDTVAQHSQIDSSSSFAATSELTGSAAFVDPIGVGTGLPDYHLSSASAAINTALPTTLAEDIDRDPRPFGPAADLGADEYIAHLYLPIIMQNFGAPDLIVTDILATSSGITVTIKNIGTGPAVDPFWVDAYINPNPVPTAVNQVWYDGRSSHGVVWGVTTALAVNQSLTLTIHDAYWSDYYSDFTPPLAVGSQVYAQVDSVNLLTTYGGVLESHELVSGPYNNVLGPVISALSAASNSQSLIFRSDSADSSHPLPDRSNP
jgi:predicted outer membrane repeat protein